MLTLHGWASSTREGPGTVPSLACAWPGAGAQGKNGQEQGLWATALANSRNMPHRRFDACANARSVRRRSKQHEQPSGGWGWVGVVGGGGGSSAVCLSNLVQCAPLTGEMGFPDCGGLVCWDPNTAALEGWCPKPLPLLGCLVLWTAGCRGWCPPLGGGGIFCRNRNSAPSTVAKKTRRQ